MSQQISKKNVGKLTEQAKVKRGKGKPSGPYIDQNGTKCSKKGK